VNRADPRDGEHRGNRLGDHRHIDGDPVALADPEALEDVGQALDLVGQLGVGDAARVAGLSLPQQRDPVAVARFDVPVEAVVGDVERAIREPLRERGSRPVEHLCERRVPVQLARLLRPEVSGALIELGATYRTLGESCRRGEPPGLVQQVVDLTAHSARSFAGLSGSRDSSRLES
jgi:hypothetical protein